MQRTPNRLTAGQRFGARHVDRMLSATDAQRAGSGVHNTVNGWHQPRRRPRRVAPFPWDKLCFGFRLEGANALINDGMVQIGDKVPVWVGGERSRTITENEQFVAVEYDFEAGTTSIGAPTTEEPKSDGTHWRFWLFQFSLDSGGNAVLVQIGHMGNVLVPAMYGD